MLTCDKLTVLHRATSSHTQTQPNLIPLSGMHLALDCSTHERTGPCGTVPAASSGGGGSWSSAGGALSPFFDLRERRERLRGGSSSATTMMHL